MCLFLLFRISVLLGHNHFLYVDNYADAVAYRNFRRAQNPAVYNELRICQAPIPNIEQPDVVNPILLDMRTSDEFNPLNQPGPSNQFDVSNQSGPSDESDPLKQSGPFNQLDVSNQSGPSYESNSLNQSNPFNQPSPSNQSGLSDSSHPPSTNQPDPSNQYGPSILPDFSEVGKDNIKEEEMRLFVLTAEDEEECDLILQDNFDDVHNNEIGRFLQENDSERSDDDEIKLIVVSDRGFPMPLMCTVDGLVKRENDAPYRDTVSTIEKKNYLVINTVDFFHLVLAVD